MGQAMTYTVENVSTAAEVANYHKPHKQWQGVSLAIFLEVW